MSSSKKFLSVWFYPLLLLLVFFLAFFLRFYKLGGVPVGFHRDEAFLGYNAYAILKTAHDMTGSFLPIHLQSFLYSPAGYSYFSIPFISMFGLTEFAVRFPSAFFGSITILVAYFLTVYLFRDYKFNKKLGIVTAFLLAVSPWHINLSRVATENVLVVFFISLGVLLYLLWVRKQKIILLIVAFVCFDLCLFIYQAPRAFLPVFLPLIFFVFRPKSSAKNISLLTLLFLITIIFPIFVILFSPKLSQRIHMLSIFQFPQTQLVLNEQIREDGIARSSLATTRIFHNKAVSYSSTFLQNYFKHFSYDFLFTDAGFPDRYRVPQMGLLYLFELPLFLFGIWRLLLLNRKVGMFLLGWIMLAPLGSAFTFDDVPNLQRTLIVFPALSLIVSFGILEFWFTLRSVRFGWVIKGAFILVLLYSFFYYLHQYYVNQIYHRPWYRQEGYKELVAKVNTLQPGYKKVIMTESETDPAIFFLFYGKYNPLFIQQAFRKNPTTAYGSIAFEKYQFIDSDCPLHEITVTDPASKVITTVLNGERGVLYVNRGACTIPQKGVKVIDIIRRSDNTPVFMLVTMGNTHIAPITPQGSQHP